MSDLTTTVLKTLAEGPVADSRAAFPDHTTAQLQGTLQSLAGREMVVYKAVEEDKWELTDEGKEIVSLGSHEFRLYEEVCKGLEGLELADVASKLGASGKIGQQRAFKNGWVKKEGSKLIKSSDSVSDKTAEDLKTIEKTGTLANDPKELQDLKKRKLVVKVKQVWFEVSKGPEFALTVKEYATDVTSDMIQSGAWKDAAFKPYNFAAEGVQPQSGAFHPLNKVREEFRQIFFSLGFSEMPTNQYVDSGFWNFDTLFVPQKHPARDLQDTFYVKDPLVAGLPEDMEYWNNVKRVHEDGAYGSIGYRYEWKPEEAQKLVLRTHTTAVSAKMLHQLAKDPKPSKLFSIDRVFRNEAVDATHLAEFHQVEGVVADYNLTLGDLIGFMQMFFSQMGVKQLRFKPAYNPYTEPSLEIFSWHEGLGKWVEIGNSGMFRPEMLEAMGLPKDLRVHGWGLSLERPTMIKYGVSNIRELLGHKVSLDFVENNPAVRLDEGLN